MAGPNVGHISVTVDADTSKLKAQMVRGGKVAAEATAEEIEQALANLNASISEIDGEREARLLRTQLEAALRGIDVGLDFTQAREDLKKFDESAEAEQLVLDVELNKISMGEAEARLTEMSEKQRQVFFDTELRTLETEAELEKLGESSVRVEALVELDRKLFDVGIERIRRERREARIRLELDKARVDAELARYEHLKRIDVPFGGDFTALNAELAAQSRRISTQQMNVNIGADTKAAMFELLGFKEFTEKQKFDANVEMQTLGASIAYDKFLLIEQAKSLGLDVDMELTEAELLMLEFRRRQAADAVEVPVDLDTSKADASGRGLSTRWQAIIAGIVLLAEPAAVALEGLLGPAIEVVSSGFSALAGGIGAATPIVAAFGAVIGGIVIGAKGMGDAMKAVTAEMDAANAEMRPFNANAEDLKKAMNDLSPAAKDFALAWGAVTPAFRQFQDTVSEELFRDLADVLQETATTVLPDLAGAFGLAASSANEFFKELASTAEEINFTKLFAELKPAVDDVFDAIRTLIGAVEPLFQAIAPASRILAESLKLAAGSLADMIEEGSKSGKLGEFFIDAVHSLQAWGDLLKEIGDALFTLFEAGTKGGDGLVKSLTNIVGKFDDWMESVEGQDALRAFFDTAREILADMLPLLEGAQGFFDNLISDGAVGRFGDLTDALGNVLPMLGSLLELVGRTNVLQTFAELLSSVADALVPILPDLQKLADAFGESLGGALAILEPLLTPLAEVLAVIAQILTPLAPFITAIAVAFTAWKVISSIDMMLGNLVTTVGKFATANVYLTAFVIAAGLAFAAFQALGAEEREVSARAAEVSRVLEDQVQVLLDTAEAGTTSALGVKALSKALVDAGGDGDKLNKALGTLGKTGEQSLDVLLSFGKGGATADAALRELTRSAGLTGKGVDQLIKKVKDADDPFFGVSEANTALAKTLGITTDQLAVIGHSLEEVQDQANKTDLDQMIRDFLAMTAASSDTNQALLAQAEAHTKLNRTGTDLIPLYNTFTDLMGKDAIASREETIAKDGMTEAQYRANQAYEAGIVHIDGFIESADRLQVINGLLVDSTGAVVGELSKLGDFTGIPNAALEGILVMNEAFKDIAQNAQLAGRRAQGFSDQMSLFVAPGRNVEGSFISLKNAIADTDELLEGGTEATQKREEAADALADALASDAEAQAAVKAGDDAGAKAAVKTAAKHRERARQAQAEADALKAGAKTLDVNTEAGLKNRDALIAQAEATQTYLEELIASGASSEDVLNAYNLLRGGLETTANKFEDAGTAAEDLATAVLGVPDTVKVAIETPNLLETTGLVADLGQAMVEIPVSPSTTFTTPGLPETKAEVEGYGKQIIEFPTFASTNFDAETDIARNEVTEFGTSVLQVPGTWLTTFSVDTKKATDDVDAFHSVVVDFPTFPSTTFDVKKTETTIQKTEYESVGVVKALEDAFKVKTAADETNKTFTAEFETQGVDTAVTDIGELDDAIDGLTTNKKITITVDDAVATTKLTNLKTLIDSIKSKTISITVNQVAGTKLPPGTLPPGTTIPGDMAGELITHPTLRRVGERGLREAIIPLDLPLNRVDPSVRALAELLRGGGTAPGGGIGRQVNNYMTITPSSSDPGAVATQIINRAAALAAR